MAYIRYSPPTPKGTVYATLVDSVRHGAKVEQKYLANLGRVIDRQKGIFTNRERGIFQYSIESGYADVSSTYEESAMRSGKTEKLILDFGDSFILDKYIRSLPFWDALSKVIPSDSDTLMSLLFYRILTDKKAYCYADTWWTGNYASVLFPASHLKSQQVRRRAKIT
ncbi:MAG: hypothetical protein LBF83_02910 [Spirochaetaceae bacterium]|jgi:hypothetical protein|nr:hypothetical protein [Spirochaetaceae bacterium]